MSDIYYAIALIVNGKISSKLPERYPTQYKCFEALHSPDLPFKSDTRYMCVAQIVVPQDSEVTVWSEGGGGNGPRE